MSHASVRPLPPASTHAESLHGLPSVVAAQEAERLRVARELHDELGQQLLALKLELSRLAQAEDVDSGQALQRRVRGLLPLVDDSMAAVRRIAAGLRPPELDETRLESALQALAAQARARLSVNVEVDARLDGLGENHVEPEHRLAIYRIAQEALSNAVRHACASSVRVVLQAEGECLVLRVCDDGLGLAGGGRAAGRGLGLLGMRERAEACGGRLDVGEAPGGGWVVVARLPLPRVVRLRRGALAGEVN